MENLHPTKDELILLTLGYNRFLDLYEEIVSDKFWQQSAEYRLMRIKDICAVYVELLKYPVFAYIFSSATRPNYELVGKGLAKFLRNILLHFPYFKEWSDIFVNKTLITTFEKTGSIDTFLTRAHPETIKYRFWEADKKKMTYVQINLQTKYPEGEDVYLKDIISEEDGVKFLCIFMKDILMTQVGYVKKL